MYRWIWRHLPGQWPLKLVGCLVLFVGVVALLFLVVFPWIDPKLPWNNVGVNGGAVVHSVGARLDLRGLQ